MKIALLGAESTGKTQLAGELAAQLRRRGRQVVVVDEVLREWCVREGRQPNPAEQLPIALEQERRVDQATAGNAIVVSDSTALMVAIYSGMLFPDGELYRFALERQRSYDLTLLAGLDLPWVADGLQRAGPHVREDVDALIRKSLGDAGVAYRVVYGLGAQRLANALAAVDPAAAAGAVARPVAAPRWQWNCEKCSDPQCEHRLFTSKIAAP
jgi:nicotinamide riboside kinase